MNEYLWQLLVGNVYAAGEAGVFEYCLKLWILNALKVAGASELILANKNKTELSILEAVLVVG